MHFMNTGFCASISGLMSMLAWASTAYAVEPQELRAYGTSAQYDGALCPAESISFGDVNQQGVSLGFSAAESDATTTGSPAVGKLCEVVVPLSIASGYKFADPQICFNYSAFRENGDVYPPIFSVGYGYRGGATHWSGRFVTEESAYECLTLAVPPTESCASETVELVLTIVAVAQPGSYLSVVDLVADFAYDGGAKWASCGDAPLPGPAAFHETCGGQNDRPCAAGFVCGLRHEAEGFDTGTCVFPDERFAREGQRCGGAARVLCEPDLVCLVESPTDELGTCRGG